MASDVVTSIFSGYECMNVHKQTNEDFTEEQSIETRSVSDLQTG
ncbi:hypothetical protein [Vibrio coralliirubri]|nr:hypothetical protein [Vibrio coralliirubri]